MTENTLSLTVGQTRLTADYVGPKYWQVFENGRFIRNEKSAKDVRKYFQQRARHLANPCLHYVDNQGLCHECGKPMSEEYYLAYAGDTLSSRRLWREIVAAWNAANKHEPA